MGLGLGKTATALTALVETIQLYRPDTQCLVVAPRRVVDLSWPNEIEEWNHLQGLKVENLRTKPGLEALTKGKRADIWLVNPERLPQVCGGRFPFNHLIVDELTKAKNPQGKRFKALWLKLQQHDVQYRWGLTGTPNPNSLMELYGQIRLLDDGKRFGKSFDAFKRRFFFPTDYMEYNWEPYPQAEQQIYELIADMALVLRREDYGGLPDPEEHDIEIQLPAFARKQYEELEKEFLLHVGRGSDLIMAPNAAALAGKLLQMCGGAAYISDTEVKGKWAFIHDAKINVARAFCHAHKKEPILIAYNYQHERDRLLKALPGAVVFPEKGQKEFLEKWNAGKVPILITHPASLGHGLNMQYGGRLVLWFSPTHSRELYDQLNARLSRRNQTKTVEVHRILCVDTYDDAVVETLTKRHDGQRALLAALRNLQRLRTTP